MTTPVVFFAYNRPQTTLRVLEALARQTRRPEAVMAFSDAPARPADEPGVHEVREVLRRFRDLSITLVERPANLGSAANIVSGLNEVLARHPQAIVVEDDVLPSESFCESMERLLDVYRNQPQVFSAGGYPNIHPHSLDRYPYDVILSPRFSCWGWGTWADRWQSVGAALLRYRPSYVTPDQIPRHAGDDLVQAVRMVNKFPGRYWDYPLMLQSLEKDWLHAHTRSYLTHNIGLDGGVNYRTNPRLKKFLAKTNPLARQVPFHYPEVALQPEVAMAVRRYVAARDRAASPTWVDRVYAFVLRVAARRESFPACSTTDACAVKEAKNS